MPDEIDLSDEENEMLDAVLDSLPERRSTPEELAGMRIRFAAREARKKNVWLKLRQSIERSMGN